MTGTAADRDERLLQEIEAERGTGQAVRARVVADDRVIARISDGIYREPASALRELVANAYDADATRVSIQTDWPRFGRITVRDNGAGMSNAQLVRMINHIGGSAKRHPAGRDLGVSSPDDASLSPSGRKLIGKIGIGLFSVAQLCRCFEIITKRRGDEFQLHAVVKLRRYAEEVEHESEGVEAGAVEIRSFRASDPDAHGTDIILAPLSFPAIQLLRSRDIWDRLREDRDEADASFTAPVFHIGTVDARGDVIDRTAQLPWQDSDSPEEKFRKLHGAVLEQSLAVAPLPRLDRTLDRYLRMMWSLGLASPVDYVGGCHPFDLSGEQLGRVFEISSGAAASPTEVFLKTGETLRQRFGLRATTGGGGGSLGFEVFLDGVKILRPLSFDGGPSADPRDGAKAPLLFFGRHSPDLAVGRAAAVPDELVLENYVLWSPRVVPVDHAGVMVRIADASGTLFDRSFMGYQAQEIRRVMQITSEVYVLRGLDAALNIDRESFNFGHPHAKIVAGWVHRSVRQCFNTQKRVAKEKRDSARELGHREEVLRTERLANQELADLGVADPGQVEFVASDRVEERRREGSLVFEREFLTLGGLRETAGRRNDEKLREYKAAALAKILSAYGLLELLPYRRQQKLLTAIFNVFEGDQ